MKRILGFVALMALVSGTPFSNTVTNESNSVAAKQDAPNMPSNMRNAHIDPEMKRESSMVVTLTEAALKNKN